MSNFPNVLKYLRENAGLTQRDLAKKLSVSQKSIDFWEDGHSEPKLSNVVALCDFFGVTLDELIGRE